ELVFADPERVQVVFRNLASNAVKYSARDKKIIFRAGLSGKAVRFEVADEGEGIPEEYLDKVFERFFRVPGTKSQGSGLGLSIAREIVAGHGGEISVSSRVGGGSCFVFTLPLAPSAETTNIVA
ncbi:MAG TPA: ATP-binding protein, partial [Candidatus Ozemobacteraceae bacterium]|nr:ATP-binding protein [Candidatus Ozemobacteraceae bacterium]